MAAPSRGPANGLIPLDERLFAQPFIFDFFQAVRLLEKLEPTRCALGHGGPPKAEIARLRVYPSLDFPASTVHSLVPPVHDPDGPPEMEVAFFGLIGPSGLLPRHYTEMVLEQLRLAKGEVKTALRDWFDLFHHRLLSLFYRAWEKYRFFIAYERGAFDQRSPDAFSRAVFSLIGLGEPALRNRLRVAQRDLTTDPPSEKALGRVDDLALVRYAGFFAHRPRNTVSLEAMLTAYLRVPATVEQFQGQWFQLDASNCSALGTKGPNNRMGRNALMGERVWNVQSKIRVRLGPLDYDAFTNFLPERTPEARRKAIFLVAQLVRLYVGTEIDIEIQLVLKAPAVPRCQVGRRTPLGSRLGWNAWSRSQPMPRDADDAVFAPTEQVWIE